MSALLRIAGQFRFPGRVDQIQPYGSGIINDTYVVTFANPAPAPHPRLGKRAILQRINRQVFSNPAQVLHNQQLLLHHISRQESASQTDQDFLLAPLYTTHGGESYFEDEDGEVWRATAFIEGTVSFDTLGSLQQATEVGAVLGTFHQRVHDLPIERLYDTLPGFHITPDYLRRYDQVIAAYSGNSTGSDADSEEQRFCREVITANRALADVLVKAKPPLTTRVMHGDPKLNNILFDTESGKAISIIDLDTVKPGLIHYDIGDCLRSCCNRSGELPDTPANTEFDTAVCRAILQGYASGAAPFLQSQDFDYIFPATMVLPFELGLRFFTDYLQGNRYFKVSSPKDNLRRAITQFVLLQSIQRQEAAIRKIIGGMKNTAGFN
ncbi:MAG: aminoglycoside phosphotransferase family protein [Gammaproteobacteria bacterium]|nr:aminoglycoside phosphotransferase family protein [Gammaproteobacteria bacterium]